MRGRDAAVPGGRSVNACCGVRDFVFLIEECNIADANSTEFDPKTAHPVVSLWQLACNVLTVSDFSAHTCWYS